MIFTASCCFPGVLPLDLLCSCVSLVTVRWLCPLSILSAEAVRSSNCYINIYTFGHVNICILYSPCLLVQFDRSPDIPLCDWLGSKHPLTDKRDLHSILLFSWHFTSWLAVFTCNSCYSVRWLCPLSILSADQVLPNCSHYINSCWWESNKEMVELWISKVNLYCREKKKKKEKKEKKRILFVFKWCGVKVHQLVTFCVFFQHTQTHTRVTVTGQDITLEELTFSKQFFSNRQKR